MPTYEYKCTNCGHLTEAFQKMSDAALRTCPNCGKETLERIVTGGVGVIYKGEGWYVTDYSHKSSGGKERTTESKASGSKNESVKKDPLAPVDTPKSEPAAAPKTTTPKPSTKEQS